MKIGDLTELAVRNLREALLRNSLTTLGISVGIASLVAMVSLGAGLQRLVESRFERSGLFNAIFVMPESGFRRFGRPAENTPKHSPPLNVSAEQAMERLPDVLEVYPQIRFPTEAQYAGNSYPTVVAGIPASDKSSGAFDGMEGRFFSGPTAEEAILQSGFAKTLDKNPSALIGKDVAIRYAEREPLTSPSGNQKTDSSASAPSGGFSVVLKKTQLKIVGIVQTDPEGFGGFGRGQLFVPLSVAQTLHASQINDLREMLTGASPAETFETLTVRVKSPEDVPAVEAAIKKMKFRTFSLLDTTHRIQLFFAVFDMILAIFGSLALVVATLGIVNTLVMAILERRREIGVLKALGAADRDVLQIFFSEAVVMGFAGGILGVVLGWMIGRAINLGTHIYLHYRNLPSVEITFVPWWLVVVGLGFSIIVSFIAGIYPALRAARLDPVEALRYE